MKRWGYSGSSKNGGMVACAGWVRSDYCCWHTEFQESEDCFRNYFYNLPSFCLFVCGCVLISRTIRQQLFVGPGAGLPMPARCINLSFSCFFLYKNWKFSGRRVSSSEATCVKLPNQKRVKNTLITNRYVKC